MKLFRENEQYGNTQGPHAQDINRFWVLYLQNYFSVRSTFSALGHLVLVISPGRVVVDACLRVAKGLHDRVYLQDFLFQVAIGGLQRKEVINVPSGPIGSR